jgi:HSP20 family protein
MLGRTIFDEMNDFRRNFDQVFDNLYTGSRRPAASERSEWAFAPAVETGWTEDFLNLRVVLPAVGEKDLKITVQGSQLTLQGERKTPKDFGKEGMIYNQIPYGKFERTLELPSGLDLDKLQAHLHEGVLDIRIPVAAAVKPKQVQISVGPSEPARTIAA